jgi:hypothetical protein
MAALFQQILEKRFNCFLNLRQVIADTVVSNPGFEIIFQVGPEKIPGTIRIQITSQNGRADIIDFFYDELTAVIEFGGRHPKSGESNKAVNPNRSSAVPSPAGSMSGYFLPALFI